MNTVRRKTHCALCGVRDHALGGRRTNGEFMLALPISTETGRTAWPRIGTNGWCANEDGEIERLNIVRISLSRTTLNGRHASLCQDCLSAHRAEQGVFSDLFAVAV